MLVLLVGVSAEQSNPLGKVFEYTSALVWCDSTSQNLGNEIKTGKKSQAKLIAKITKKTCDIEVSMSKIEELAAALTTNEGALKDAKAIHDNEDADFAASEQELMATVVTIDHAVVGRVSSEIN